MATSVSLFRGTPSLFSVKYLFGEANIAKNLHYSRTANNFQTTCTASFMYNFVPMILFLATERVDYTVEDSKL